jgi:hypothetical protein
MKLNDSLLKKIILEVISESEEEQEEKPQEEPSQGQEQKPIKLKIDIPDEPYSGAEDRAIDEGPSYEYANYMKKIEKAENNQAKEVNKFVQLLMKKGLKKEATAVASKYVRGVAEFDNFLKIIYGKLT